MRDALAVVGIAAACLLLGTVEALPTWVLVAIIAAGAVVTVSAWFVMAVRRLRDVEMGREL